MSNTPHVLAEASNSLHNLTNNCIKTKCMGQYMGFHYLSHQPAARARLQSLSYSHSQNMDVDEGPGQNVDLSHRWICLHGRLNRGVWANAISTKI